MPKKDDGFISESEYPDEETLRELNELYHDEKLPGDDSNLRKGRSLLIKLAAVIIALGVMAFFLGGTLRVLQMPSLEFLESSRKLSQDPVISEWQEAVVQVRTAAGIEIVTAGRSGRKGSGFNISESGHIITNCHLLEGADSVSVFFPEQGSRRAVNWFCAEDDDLAIISLEGEGLPYVDLSRGPQPEIGDRLIIIGNPLGFSGTVMQGELSGYGRFSASGEAVLEIKAPIQAGSSGSPVFDGEGKVVGVVFASLAGTEEGESKGLAVPVSRVHSLLEENYENVFK